MTSDVDVGNETSYAIADAAVRRLVLAVLALEAAEGEVAVAFLTEAGMAELNGRYRGLEEPTDVLSFPEDGDAWPEPQGGDGEADDGEGADGLATGREDARPGPFLGDVAVCPEVAARYAAAEGHPLAVELGRLLVHGVLHLLGWDHETDQGEMHLREEVVVASVSGLFASLTAEA
jgi:probable rRNA maturation factor